MRRKVLYALAAGFLVFGFPMEVRAAENGARVAEAPGTEVFQSEAVFYETGIPGVTLNGAGELFYQVTHEGTGSGKMEISGNAAGSYELIVEIVKPGVIGEAVYRLSLDGGKSFIGQDVVSERCRIGGTGLTLYFSVPQDNMEFGEGEVYRVSLPETFPVAASKFKAANLVVTGHPTEDCEFEVDILSSGRLGEAKFSVTMAEQQLVADVLPEDGIYELQDDLELVFSNAEYEKGLVYSVSVKSHDDTVNYMPLYILSGAVVVAGVSVLTVLAGRKEKPGDYKLHKYEGRKKKYD